MHGNVIMRYHGDSFVSHVMNKPLHSGPLRDIFRGCNLADFTDLHHSILM